MVRPLHKPTGYANAGRDASESAIVQLDEQYLRAVDEVTLFLGDLEHTRVGLTTQIDGRDAAHIDSRSLRAAARRLIRGFYDTVFEDDYEEMFREVVEASDDDCGEVGDDPTPRVQVVDPDDILSQFAVPSLVPSLVGALKSDREARVVAAAGLLGRIDDAAMEAAVAPLAVLLVRRQAVSDRGSDALLALHNRGIPVVKYLLGAFRAPINTDFPYRVVVLLGQMGVAAQPALPLLLDYLRGVNSFTWPYDASRGSESGYRRAVAKWRQDRQVAVMEVFSAVGRLPFDACDPIGESLVQALEDPASAVIRLALDALRHFGSRARPFLIEALRRGDSNVRRFSAAVLDVSGDEDANAVRALQKCLLSDQREVRVAAIEAFGRFETKGEGYRRALRRALVIERDVPIRHMVRSMLDAFEANRRRREHSANDAPLLEWFSTLDMNLWLPQLQLFWCVGRLEHDSLMSGGRANGARKLCNIFARMKSQSRIALPTGENFIRDALAELESRFNSEPFRSAAWSGDERVADFRENRPRGRKPELYWTARGRKAWLYVDRFLELKDARPLFDLASDDHPKCQDGPAPQRS